MGWDEWFATSFGALLFIAIIVMVCKMGYWMATRGHCIERTNATVSICLAWESDLKTPEQKSAWEQWKRDHPNQNLD